MKPAFSVNAHLVGLHPGFLAGFDTVIDVRSPDEFVEDHVPGAISAPVLDNEERARVGTLYKQVSPFDAKKLGAALVAKNIARHLQNLFADRPRTWRPLVYCWRGGKRSGAMAHVLREIGWEAKSIEGGYKAWRRFVVEELSTLPLAFRYRVVHGPTGSGKSRLLAALHDAGAQVLDLEGLAAHRGSVLGGLPGQPQPAQKMFESRLWDALRRLDPARTVFVEGESKKIGQLQVPDALMHAMRASCCVLLDTSRAVRIDLLCEEYSHFFTDRASLDFQLDCLTALHGRERIASWKSLVSEGDWPELVGRLLDEHYDPAYRRSSHRNFSALAQALPVRLDGSEDAAFARAAQEALAAEARSPAPPASPFTPVTPVSPMAAA